MFFRLNSLTQLILGKNVCIYNLKDNVVYIIENEIGDFIKYCEENNPVEDHWLYTNNRQYTEKILKKMIDLKLGYISNKKIHIEKFKYNASEKLMSLMQLPPTFNKVIINYSSKCNLNCNFCKKKSFKNWQGCESCFERNYTESDISDEEVLEIVDKVKRLNINELLIKGGNPLIKIELIDKIASKFVNQNNFKLRIISNGLDINYKSLYKLLKYNFVELQLVIFGVSEFLSKYSFDSYHTNIIIEQTKLMDKFIKENINFRITFQILKQNHNYAKETINYINQKYNKMIIASNIVDDKSLEKLSFINNGNKHIPRLIHPSYYFWNKSHNKCMYGTFYIDSNRQLSPCSEVTDSIGNIGVNGEHLYDVLASLDLYEYWDKTKDDTDNCKECSLRYFCADCFEFEKSSSRKTFCNILKEDFQIDYSKIEDKEFIKQLI